MSAYLIFFGDNVLAIYDIVELTAVNRFIHCSFLAIKSPVQIRRVSTKWMGERR
ncbi:hypothetical protein AM571_PA00369 (plasmid) [Rhizobium etli 8C-3]|uniref:Uncharacterized protein n=1 Tax=Rhizobium etli 8C-3 TaxID=538025 RepID=A0A1L5PAP0_RHIET|nr:hypothetical protein AM571_PA00369 [Rhizobium etli 8C-3]